MLDIDPKWLHVWDTSEYIAPIYICAIHLLSPRGLSFFPNSCHDVYNVAFPLQVMSIDGIFVLNLLSIQFHFFHSLVIIFHYSAWCDGILNHQPHNCFSNRLFRWRSTESSKLCTTDLFVENSPVTDEFPAQRASNAENVTIWWRHHVYLTY